MGPQYPSNNGSNSATAPAEVWTVGRLLKWTEQYFASKGFETPRLDAEVLLAHALGCQRIELYTQFDKPVEPAERAVFREFVRRRGQGEPVAYIVGRKEFFSLEFEVNRSVLIPRPDSEFVVLAYLDRLRHLPHVIVADIGTGSGNLAVAIAHEHPGAQVIAVDVSQDALEVARRNAQRHGVLQRVSLVKADLLMPFPPQCFDAIVSNPPYIPRDQLGSLEPGVRDYEPHVALDGGPTGLDVVRRLIRQAAVCLRSNGWLILEIGTAQEKPVREAIEEVQAFDLDPTIHDYAGHPRVVAARRR